MDEYHDPGPSLRAFEQQLGFFIGKQPCALCELPLGNEPRAHRKFKMFHPACLDFLKRTGL